ncbi:MAG: radical SAM protein [Candidatus Sumerlaeia bacterium]|nr:radical SAM protein [Candidatus Sumerlaeia bacterium]
MVSGCTGGKVNFGYCEMCHQPVPVAREQRGQRLYLVRECPQCGHGETLISTDAKAYYEKRELMGYEGDAVETCSMQCVECTHATPPAFVVIDVTNRCNMNCPICLSNIPAMGFDFHPPIEYFDKIFQKLVTMKPRPRIQLFGGEPTCRDDLMDILKLARKRGLRARVVTNGIRLADEDYCRRMLETGPQLLFGLDGLNPEIQKKLRKNPGSLQKKLKAIENIEKYTKSKITIMCTTAVGTSEHLLPDLFKFMYQKHHLITRIMLIPLQATAGPEQVDMESNTIEDVEHLMERTFPGTEFVPAGALRLLKNIMRLYGLNVTAGGSHPNCECLALMVADPEAGEYRPVGDYLKVPFKQFVRELIAWDKAMGPKLERGLLGRLFGRAGQKAHLGVALFRWAVPRLRIRKAMGPQFFRRLLRVMWGRLTSAKTWGELFRQHMGQRSMLEVIILPYEEPGYLESARLVDCPVSFACEHPDTGEITLIPFCSYFIFKNDILRKTAERWGLLDRKKSAAPARAASCETEPAPERMVAS